MAEKWEKKFPLHAAANKGEVKRVDKLIMKLSKRGKSVDPIGPNGRTPLHLAARSGHVEIAQMLLDHDANPNALTKDGETPLHMALSFQWGSRINPTMVALLIDRGCDLNAYDEYHGWTPLYACCTLGEGGVNVARVLVEKGAEVDRRTAFGDTPLHRTIYAENFPMAKFLLEHGANVNAKSHKGKTALEMAEALSSGPTYSGEWYREEFRTDFLKLLRDWYERSATSKAPDDEVDQGGKKYPGVYGKRPCSSCFRSQTNIDILVACKCGGEVPVPLSSVDRSRGVLVQHRGCGNSVLVPPTIWCETCGFLVRDWPNRVVYQDG